MPHTHRMLILDMCTSPLQDSGTITLACIRTIIAELIDSASELADWHTENKIWRFKAAPPTRDSMHM